IVGGRQVLLCSRNTNRICNGPRGGRCYNEAHGSVESGGKRPKIACDYPVRMAATSLGGRSRDKTRSTRQVICEHHPRSVLWTFVERVDGIREVQSDANGLRRCTSMNDAQVGTRSRALVHEHKDVVGTSKRGNINQLVAVQVYQLRQSP